MGGRAKMPQNGLCIKKCSVVYDSVIEPYHIHSSQVHRIQLVCDNVDTHHLLFLFIQHKQHRSCLTSNAL